MVTPLFLFGWIVLLFRCLLGNRLAEQLSGVLAAIGAAHDARAPLLLAHAQNQSAALKEAIHDVHVPFHAIVHHLGTVRPHYDENWGFPHRCASRHLNEGFASVIDHANRAQVRSNVYDTASGKYLLIPQGSRLIGTYDTRVGFGQDGVQVVWNRIIFPDASSINLEGMVGQDAKGYAGLRYDVDNHYKRLIGMAVLTSAFSAAFQLSQTRRGTVFTYPSPGEIAGSAVAGNLSQIGGEVTRRNLNIQPTVKVPIGYRFNVRVNRDLLFESPYRAMQP